MTGGTSGLGRDAAQRIVASPDTRLLLGARTTRTGPIEMLPLDLSRWVLRPVARLATTAQGGEQLADLTLGAAAPPPGRVYASLVKRRLTWPDPSELAQRDDVMEDLW